MANRYWVLGGGVWDSASTSNWAAFSGGAPGASVPTAADNVFFDANSNVGITAFTITMAGSPRVCNDFTASGLDGIMTLSGGGIALTVSGSLTFQATNFVNGIGGTITFNATSTGKTITTNGIAVSGSVTFNGTGGGWTLGSALTCQVLTLTAGTFSTSTSNYAVTADSISSSNSNVRTLSLNASTVTLSNVNFPWATATSTNLTLNAGTSNISCTSVAAFFAGGGKTFYNVSFTSNALVALLAGMSGANTFNNLTIAGRTTVGLGAFSFSANQTINGIFTVSAGTASAYRMRILSNTSGTARTLICGTVSLTDVDFKDIVGSGAAAPFTGTRLGNHKGNTNITFTTAKTVYYRQTGNADWGATGSGSWSSTSGGALNATMFPLAQDTAVFPAATYPASTATTTINDDYHIGTIDMSLRTTNLMTLATSTRTSIVIHGNWTNGTGITISGSGTLTFGGLTTQTITSAGRSFTQPITIDSVGGTVVLASAFTTGVTRATILTNGTLSLGSFVLNTGTFSSSNSNTRTIAFGTGSISCNSISGGTVWTTNTITNLTTTGTQAVTINNPGSTATSVFPGLLSEANSISFTFTNGTYTLTFLNGFTQDTARNVLFNSSFTGTWAATGITTIYGNLTLSSGMTMTVSSNTLTFGATSGTKTIASNTKTMPFPLIFSGVGGTWQLQDNLTTGTGNQVRLDNGTLDLSSFTLTVGVFSSTNSNTRTIAFGTGNINCVGSASCWDTTTTTGLTTTGTQVVNINTSAVWPTSVAIYVGTLSEANSISFNFPIGNYSLSFLGTVGYTARNVNFTGFTGTLQGPSGTIYGNLTLASAMTVNYAAAGLTFGATSGTKTITFNGQQLNLALTFNGIGGTWACQDALYIYRTLTMINGTLQLKDGVTSTLDGERFVTSGTNLKYLQSTSSGVQATLSNTSGLNTVTFLSIQDCNATGVAQYDATATTNVNAGNNSGWIFTAGAGNFLAFFM